MAVIFLDIDGVLNRSNRKPSRETRVVEPELLARFKELVDASGATVVLASTWRHDPDALKDARRLGIPFNHVLPDLRPQSRAKEVEAWLRTHGHSGRIAVLDDDDDGYGGFPLFQPNPRKGLTPQVADAVLAYLNGTRQKDLRRSIFVRMAQSLRSLLLGHRG
jgi:hypothetical protein